MEDIHRLCRNILFFYKGTETSLSTEHRDSSKGFWNSPSPQHTEGELKKIISYILGRSLGNQVAFGWILSPSQKWDMHKYLSLFAEIGVWTDGQKVTLNMNCIRCSSSFILLYWESKQHFILSNMLYSNRLSLSSFLPSAHIMVKKCLNNTTEKGWEEKKSRLTCTQNKWLDIKKNYAFFFFGFVSQIEIIAALL